MTQSNVTPRSPIHAVVDGGSTTGFRRSSNGQEDPQHDCQSHGTSVVLCRPGRDDHYGHHDLKLNSIS